MQPFLAALSLCALTAALPAPPLRAEILHARFHLKDLDCASCAGALDRALKRQRDIESFEIDAAAGVLRMKFKPGNQRQLAALREFLQSRGHRVEQVQFQASGAIEAGARFVVAGTGEAFALPPGSPGRELSGQTLLLTATTTPGGSALQTAEVTTK